VIPLPPRPQALVGSLQKRGGPAMGEVAVDRLAGRRLERKLTLGAPARIPGPRASGIA